MPCLGCPIYHQSIHSIELLIRVYPILCTQFNDPWLTPSLAGTDRRAGQFDVRAVELKMREEMHGDLLHAQIFCSYVYTIRGTARNKILHISVTLRASHWQDIARILHGYSTNTARIQHGYSTQISQAYLLDTARIRLGTYPQWLQLMSLK